MLVMTRGADIGGPEALGAQIGHEVAVLEGLLQALDRVAATDPAAQQDPDHSPPAPAPLLHLHDAALTGDPSADKARDIADIDPNRADRWLQ